MSKMIPLHFKELCLIIAGQSCYNRGMKRELMDILVCPVCKGELQLTVAEENQKEIVSGSLHCGQCRVDYPIADAIPNLLPPDQRD